MGWPKGKPRKIAPDIAEPGTEQPEPKRKPKVVDVVAPAMSEFDYKKFGEAMAFAIREGSRDPNKEKRELEHRLRMRKQLSESSLADLAKWKNCSHMRGHPYSGTSRIAWSIQSDGLTRGPCMLCGCVFTPVESELPFPEEMKDWYRKMIGVPMTAAQNDFVTGMVAAGNPA